MSFIKAYDIEGIKFQGDIACCAHVLNIATQDIIGSIIKLEEPIEDLDAIRQIEEEEEDLIRDNTLNISKFFILL